METWFRHLFLITLIFNLSLVNGAHAQTPEITDESVLIEPGVKRSDFDESKIDTDDFELILTFGYLSLEDFGVNALLAIKINYYVNEDIFVQATIGQSKGGETSYEILTSGAPLLTDSEREVSYYNVNLGYNLLPGEAFLGDQIAYNTALYLTVGIGNTDFAGDERYTFNYGAGYRFLLNDSFTIYTDFRNNVFDIDVFGTDKTTNNLEFTMGLGYIF